MQRKIERIEMTDAGNGSWEVRSHLSGQDANGRAVDPDVHGMLFLEDDPAFSEVLTRIIKLQDAVRS